MRTSIKAVVLRKRLDREKGVSIKITTGDQLLEDRKFPLPNVIKLDAEGAEYLVLKRMKNILASPICRFLSMELHPELLQSFENDADDVMSIILNAGFSIRGLIERGDEVHIIANKI